MKKQVIFYTTRKCAKCKSLKNWLRRNKVPFLTKSLDETEVMASLIMRNIFVLAAPAIETGDRVFLSDQIFGENGLLRSDFLKREMQKIK